ncbi:hypothetical protein JXB41_00845 [Candidatus Woesearchaeota archaeon]|nr:hypothetical protein [Candidatus Woesearchaeota archaeon]
MKTDLLVNNIETTTPEKSIYVCEDNTIEQEQKENIAEIDIEDNTIEEMPQEEKTQKLVMFHNGKGPMCIEQLEFLEDIKKEYIKLVVEEYLTTEEGTHNLIYEFMSNHEKSLGVSDNFGYLPITFINNHAYSGFNNEVKKMITKDIKEVYR